MTYLSWYVVFIGLLPLLNLSLETFFYNQNEIRFRTESRLQNETQLHIFHFVCAYDISSDEYIRIYSNFEISNFEISNFEKRIRMSNLIEFNFLKLIRLNSTSHLAKIGLFKSLFNQKRSFYRYLGPIISFFKDVFCQICQNLTYFSQQKTKFEFMSQIGPYIRIRNSTFPVEFRIIFIRIRNSSELSMTYILHWYFYHTHTYVHLFIIKTPSASLFFGNEEIFNTFQTYKLLFPHLLSWNICQRTLLLLTRLIQKI